MNGITIRTPLCWPSGWGPGCTNGTGSTGWPYERPRGAPGSHRIGGVGPFLCCPSRRIKQKGAPKVARPLW